MISICAVVPAAGRGSRLGLSVPKILAPIDGTHNVWAVLRHVLLAVVPRVHVIVAPDAASLFETELDGDPERHRISTSIQPEPKGMGDAIFGAHSVWKCCEAILVLWGDQVNISEATVRCAVAASSRDCTLTVPLVVLENPYVHYDFDSDGRLVRILQSREGDVLEAKGLSDVGLFVLSTKGLWEVWQNYLRCADLGATTGEVNFLPFLSYLSVEAGWQVRTIPVVDPDEAIGINSFRDLEFSRMRLTRARPS
jgi:bifunctional UDP-N-acetylglucosamine pyrophosphorylase/glucosamine-1-phosphate N-acetyltransferase